MSEALSPDGLPEQVEASERQALAALASELRAAHPDPALSPDFTLRLRARLRLAWHWHDAFRRQPFLRLAAGILVACGIAVPVSAAMYLLLARPGQRPVLEIEFLPQPAQVPRLERDLPAQPPYADLDEVQLRALADGAERHNRFALASHDWRRTFPLRLGRAPSAFDLEALPRGARAGLELRLGLRAAAVVAAIDWASASADELWAELQRCLARDQAQWPASLERRVDELWQAGASGDRAWLAEWRYILHGEPVAAPWALHAGPEALRVFWEAVRWSPPPSSPPR